MSALAVTDDLFFNRAGLDRNRVEGIVAQGYRVVDDWQNSEVRCHVPMARNRSVDAYSGYFFERLPAAR